MDFLDKGEWPPLCLTERALGSYLAQRVKPPPELALLRVVELRTTPYCPSQRPRNQEGVHLMVEIRVQVLSLVEAFFPFWAVEVS